MKFNNMKNIPNYKLISQRPVLLKSYDFARYFFKDVRENRKNRKFSEYGIKLYCGKQGSGKTISMVEELERIRHQYPEVPIYTNFGYIYETGALTDWLSILTLRNDNGIVFAIDEIQNEFDVYDSRNFNIRILRTITQQRKQGIRILASAQQFNRVTKPIREQTFEVVECVTLAGRWVFQKCFDAYEYSAVIDNPDKKQKLKRLGRRNFVQTPEIRSLYDSYAVINNMAELEKEARKVKALA